MTKEILDKCNEINNKIKSYRNFLEAFNSSNTNIIESNYYEGNKNILEIVVLDNEPELESMIIKYISDKIANLEKEFEKI